MIKYIYKFDNYKGEHDKKKLKLLKLILEGKVQTDKEANHILYQYNCNSALCQLKKRLQQDILNIILLSPFTYTTEEAAKDELSCHKSILLGKVLINRGLLQEGIHLLEKTSTFAEKCELLNVKLACDDTLRTIQRSTGNSTCETYREKINCSLEKIKDLLQAKTIYFSVLQMESFSIASFLPDFELSQLEEKLSESNSTKATYWYAMALIRHYTQEKDYRNARNCTSKLLDKVNKNLHIISVTEQADFHLQCARISIYSGEPQEAIKPAQLAVRLFHESKQDMLTAMEVLFFAYFQNSNWRKAEELTNRVYKANEMPNEEVAGIWGLLKSSLLFKQNKFRESNTWLLSHEHLLNEKSPIFLWTKLLELLNILEIQDYDWFEYRLESLRKRLRRWRIQSVERIWLLFQLLNSLRKYDYNYQRTLLHEQENLAVLQCKDQPLGWDPLSYELINISEWFVVKFSKGKGSENIQKFGTAK